MVGGAAGHDVDFADFGGLLRRKADIVQPDGLPRRDPAGHGVADRLGLLVDFLHHEVLEAALFRRARAPGHVVDLLVQLLALQRIDADPGGREDRELLVFQIEDVPRMVQNRGDVRGDEILAFPDSDNQRAVFADRDDFVRLLDRDDAERVAALHHGGRFFDRLQQVALVEMVDQVRDDLGVGLRIKAVAQARQPFL